MRHLIDFHSFFQDRLYLHLIIFRIIFNWTNDAVNRVFFRIMSFLHSFLVIFRFGRSCIPPWNFKYLSNSNNYCCFEDGLIGCVPNIFYPKCAIIWPLTFVRQPRFRPKKTKKEATNFPKKGGIVKPRVLPRGFSIGLFGAKKGKVGQYLSNFNNFCVIW